MPRTRRDAGQSGLYHVMIRGNGKQILFENNSNRSFYLEKLGSHLSEGDIQLLAWCLMDNHAHLLVRCDPDKFKELSTAMARVNGSYARHFNSITGHVGHVFQDRFLCKAIDSKPYLLEVVRYIHNNPESAGICPSDKYRWSSYSEYVGTPSITHTQFVLDMVGGPDGFRRFVKGRANPALRLRCELCPTPETLLSIAREVLDPISLESIAGLPKSKRDRCLQSLHKTGFSVRQIQRMTGIGKSTIFNVISHCDKH